MSKVLVTGVNGFVGHHLASELHENGFEVIGAGHEHSLASDLRDIVSDYLICDLTDYQSVSKLPLEDINAVINLAGLAAVGKSFDEPELYMRVNVSVLSTLCERIKEIGRNDLRVLAISSGALYASGQPMPLSEESLTDSTTSPYAASKLAMEKAALDFRDEGLDCVVVRPFNHIGPGQMEGFLLPDLYAKLKSSGDTDEIRVGNLETKRDYTDVRDVARAYIGLSTKASLEHGIYNVCSGRPVSGEEILAILKEVCGRTAVKAVVDKSQFRPSDAPVIYGDNSRLKAEIGWQPLIPLGQTIKDFVNENQGS